MATQQDVMVDKVTSGGIPKTSSSQPERRGTRRCKITQLMRVRPSDPEKDHFEDLRGSVSVSRSGVYGLINSNVFKDFPTLKVVVSHGGGAIPADPHAGGSMAAPGGGGKMPAPEDLPPAGKKK